MVNLAFSPSPTGTITHSLSAFLGMPRGTVLSPSPWQSTLDPEQVHLLGHPSAAGVTLNSPRSSSSQSRPEASLPTASMLACSPSRERWERKHSHGPTAAATATGAGATQRAQHNRGQQQQDDAGAGAAALGIAFRVLGRIFAWCLKPTKVGSGKKRTDPPTPRPLFVAAAAATTTCPALLCSAQVTVQHENGRKSSSTLSSPGVHLASQTLPQKSNIRRGREGGGGSSTADPEVGGATSAGKEIPRLGGRLQPVASP